MIAQLKLDIKHTHQEEKRARQDGERFHQAACTISKVTDRKENDSDMINHEISNIREEIRALQDENRFLNNRRAKL